MAQENVIQKYFKRLRPFNLAMAFLHMAQGLIMVVISSDFSLPVRTSFLSFDRINMQLLPQYETWFNLKIGPTVAVFLFISALAHLLISLPGIYEWYEKNIKRGINQARWLEYAFSSSVMIVIIAMLVGVYDLAALILMFAVNAGMILFGWIMELHNQDTAKTSWLSFIFGSIMGIVPWIIIALYLFLSGDGDAKAPTFVYWIFFSLFVFFNTFAINMLLQYKKVGRWKNYVYGEYVYIVLSLVAKSLLAWQVFAGTLRPV